MEKEFVPYELSLELKQLGFDEPCFGWFTGSYLRIGSVVENKHVQGEDEILAPLYSQAFRWFRHNGKVAEIFSQLLPSNKYKWGFKIQGVEGITDGFLTYEEAESACLQKLIEIVKGQEA